MGALQVYAYVERKLYKDNMHEDFRLSAETSVVNGTMIPILGVAWATKSRKAIAWYLH